MVYGVGGEDKADSSSRINEELSRADIPASSVLSDLRRAPRQASCAATRGARCSRGTTSGTGERVELSVATYANWVAKVASLLVEEHDLERGDVLLVDLPSHWLGPVFLGAAWTAGLAVAFPSSDVAPNAVVCGPASLATWAPRADDLPVLACSLLPMGVRFAEPLPPGVHDVGVEVWGQPDAFTPYDPPGGSDVALVDGPVTQDELFGEPGRRRELTRTRPAATGSCRRRTRLPHQVSPPFRGRSCRAARWSSWRGRTRLGSTRSLRPSGSPTAWADQPAPAGDVRAGVRAPGPASVCRHPSRASTLRDPQAGRDTALLPARVAGHAGLGRPRRSAGRATPRSRVGRRPDPVRRRPRRARPRGWPAPGP